MKKILLLLVISMWILGFAQAFDIAWCEERTFTVTAYYSPEPGQIFYYKPSFLDEVILNGEGYTWASGKKVFNGMLAAPVTYPFGSVIYFPGIGIGEVADRGGAIVLSWERGQIADRIDIRMGRWEEGLIRALTFGKKTLKGRYCQPSVVKSKKNIWLDLDAVASVPRYFFDMAIWIQELKPGRKDIRVRTLQKYLVKLWYLNFKHRHGDYNSYTKKALCAYQVKKWIVGSKHLDCGTFWPRTRYTMKLDVQNKGLLPANFYEKGNLAILLELAQRYNGKPVTNTEAPLETKGNPAELDKGGSEGRFITETKKNDIFRFYRAYTKWQQSSEIKILQNFLTEQELYSWPIDGVYSKTTINALYEFQKKYGLISDTDELALRGYLGPKTRAKINELRREK